MPPTEDAPAVVVGGGAAGLAAAASLGRLGVAAVVLERGARIGDSWRDRYSRLHLHTTRRFSALPHRALPPRLPRYVGKDDYAAYLDDFARAENLDVRLGHDVLRVARADGDWVIDAGARSFRAGAVVLAAGKHRVPRVPDWPGREEYRGRLVHSGAYRDGAPYEARRALVVGIGNSGAEIASDLVRHGAAAVEIAVRTPPPIVRREVLGVPVQILGMALMPLPPRLADRIGAVARRIAVGDLRRYGIGPAAWGPFAARRPPLIDVGFLADLRTGRIAVRPAVERLTPDGAAFAGGDDAPYDVVVAATGFAAGLPELLHAPEALDARGEPRLSRGGASPVPGLYFVGYRESPRGTLYEIRRDAPLLAEQVAAYLTGR